MKPIEIHIEGYKIVISEDKEPEETKETETEKITYVPCPYSIIPTTPNTPQPDDRWKYPYVTWTGGDMTITNMTDYKPWTPIRDAMTGKEVTDEDASRN